MNGHHLQVDQLIDQIYGLEDHAHLRLCAECAARWRATQARRKELAPSDPVSNEFLAAQRRTIYARLEQPAPRRLRWLPALAAAGVLAIMALVYKPSAPPVVRPDPGDAQLFSEVYSMEQSTEPAAAAPIHELFEDEER